MANRQRHILGLSGGKDSTALAIYLHDKISNMEYFFCDTGCELPETYEFLERVKARLGITITYLSAERGFDHWLQVYNGYLPSARSRWCTRKLKIEPLEKFIGDDDTVSYIGIRADEDRDGYISDKDNINPTFPFKEDGLKKADVIRLLDESGIGMPEYYKWRSRSGCYFCFFQRKYEWIMLSKKHPSLFEKAVQYETTHSDGRKYYWSENESLFEIVQREEQILKVHSRVQDSLRKGRRQRDVSSQRLIDVLEELVLNDEAADSCPVCHI